MEHRSQRTGSGRGHRQGSYSFCCMSGWDFATRCRKVGSMQKYSFETWQEETLRHGVAKLKNRNDRQEVIKQSAFHRLPVKR